MCPSTRVVPHRLPHTLTTVRDPADTSWSAPLSYVHAGHRVVYEHSLTQFITHRPSGVVLLYPSPDPAQERRHLRRTVS